MFYYTYLVVCTEGKFQGKVYFGCHRTSNLNDGYIASGKLIRNYLKKYPNDYYREIIKFYSSEEELQEAERELIKPHFNKDYCLNLCEGGLFGKMTNEIRQKISNKKRGISIWPNGRKFSEETKQKMAIAQQNRKRKPLSEETKRKLSEKLKGHIISEETRQKISKSCKGHIPPNKGIPQSDEQKRRHSEFMKGCKSPIKGKHRVWDNKELNIYHYE